MFTYIRYPIFVSPVLFLVRSLVRLVAIMKSFPRRPGQIVADPTHVIDNARRMRSPLSQHDVVLSLLLQDKDFVAGFNKNGFPYMLEISTDGAAIRSNLYFLERQGEDPDAGELSPAFNSKWMATGVTRFIIHSSQKIELVRRENAVQLYDPQHVAYSYVRRLNPHERADIGVMLCN